MRVWVIVCVRACMHACVRASVLCMPTGTWKYHVCIIAS